jgi:uncharacterized membrane protein YkoI
MKQLPLVFLGLLVVSISTVSLVFADDREELALTRYVIESSGITFKKAYNIVSEKFEGIIHSYELEDEDDRLVHEFKIINIEEKRHLKVEMDAKTGEISVDKKKLKWRLFGKDEDFETVKLLTSEGMSLIEAVEIIYQQFPQDAKFILDEIDLELDQGVLYFEVETEDMEGDKQWLVDTATKSLIPVFK